MFPRASIKPPKDTIADVQKTMSQYPTLTNTAIKRNGGKVLRAWEEALQEEPPPASRYYPLRTRSRKQLRKIHALRRERGGGAYQRTHQLVRAWKVRMDTQKDYGTVTAQNRNPAAQFVYGTDSDPRQPMFDPAKGGIPWLNPDAVNAKFAAQFGDVLEATVTTIANPTFKAR